MLLVVDLLWQNVLERQAVYSIAGTLKKLGPIDRAIVFFPDTFHEKRLMISFVRSLQNSGVSDVRLVIRTSKFDEADLDLIRLADQKEFILLEDDLTFHTINSDTISVRLWLTFLKEGDNLQKLHKWEGYIRQLAAVEPAPFFARPAEQVEWLASSLSVAHNQCDLSNATVLLSNNITCLSIDASLVSSCTLHAELSAFINVAPIVICCGNARNSASMNLRKSLTDQPVYYDIHSVTRDHIRGNAMLFGSNKIEETLSEFTKRVLDNATKLGV